MCSVADFFAFYTPSSLPYLKFISILPPFYLHSTSILFYEASV